MKTDKSVDLEEDPTVREFIKQYYREIVYMARDAVKRGDVVSYDDPLIGSIVDRVKDAIKKP